MKRLDGKVAAVTGAASGIGFATAMRLASDGATVIILDLNEENGSKCAAEISAGGGHAAFFRLDVTSEEDWDSLVEFAKNEYGSLHILVNCAGINVRYALTEMDLADWNQIINVCLTGIMLGMRATAPLIRDSGGGAMVNIGSAAGILGHPNTAYTTAKHGLVGLSKSAALELIDWGIRVNMVHPGTVRTPMMDPNGSLALTFAEYSPAGRAAMPEEIAAAISFLVSDDSSYITGTELPVDAGFSSFSLYRRLWADAQAKAAKKGDGFRT